MSRYETISKHNSKISVRNTFFGLGLLLLSACATTEKASIDRTTLDCVLLKDICGKLQPGSKYQAGLIYVNPASKGKRYNKVIIPPVTFWGGAETKVSAPDQQTLVNFFTEQLNEALGKKFQIVNQPGPGVMDVTVAMIDAETATPGLRTISVIVPQANLLSSLQSLATGSHPFVGSARGEAMVIDSETGQIMAGAVDKRIGGGSPEAGLQWQWGDTENAIKVWCEMLADFLSFRFSGAAPR